MRVSDSILALGWALSLALPGCRSQPAEAAPPPASYEIASAAPGARGARAAGTDAAPPPPNERDLAEPGDPSEGDDSDGGIVSDGGPVADSAPGVAL